QPRRIHEGAGAVDSRHRVCRSDRLLHPVPREMTAFLLLADVDPRAGQIGEIARTFGVDWPHLTAQVISFSIVCALLYLLAYRPIVQMLDARRRQIAQGLATAGTIEVEWAGRGAEREEVLREAYRRGTTFLEAARAAAARLRAHESQKAAAAAEQIIV